EYLHEYSGKARECLLLLKNGSTYIDTRQKVILEEALKHLDELDFRIEHPAGIIEAEVFNLSIFMRVVLDGYRFMVRAKELQFQLGGCEKTISARADK